MPRIDVPFIVENQSISQPSRVELVSGGQNYFYATFKLSEMWLDITDLKAVFVRGDMSKLIDLQEGNDCLECRIPWEVMANKGVLEVGIFGGDRLLTNYAYVVVKQGCVTDGEVPESPSEDWFGKVDKALSELDSEKASLDDVYTIAETEDIINDTVNNALKEYYTEEEVKEYVGEQTEIIKSDVEGLQKQINEEAHFRGYLSTNAKIQSMESTPNDFSYSAESGTKWVYDAEEGWKDTGTPVPDQLTPASNATPLVDGEASAGQSEEYARGDHRHPTDTTRVSVEEFNGLKSDINEALDRIIAIQNELIGGDAE